MTETLEDSALEESAQRIADHGRDVLLARLRPAFEQAAAPHAELLELDEERIEEIVQRAADNADGLQWRRALASAATEELGIGLGEAIGHPAVARAQSIAGAPPYEDSVTAARSAKAGAQDAREAPSDGNRANRDHARENEPLTGAEPDLENEPDSVALSARHLHGVPDLANEEGELVISLSAHGLDVAHSDKSIIGRLSWEDIVEFDIPGGGRMRRRTELIVRTSLGEATFEVASSASKLRRQLEPLIKRYLADRTG